MKRHDLRIVEDILMLTESYYFKKGEIEAIAKKGPHPLQVVHEHHGQMPEASLYKKERVSDKAEECRQYTITQDERRAHDLMMSFRVEDRMIICAWLAKRGERMPDGSGRRWTVEAIALLCGFKTVERYLEVRADLCEQLVERWLGKKAA